MYVDFEALAIAEMLRQKEGNMSINDIGSGTYRDSGIMQNQQIRKNQVSSSALSDTDSSDFMAALQSKKAEIVEKIKNGDTEESFQIGGKSYTDKEWKKLVKRFDKNIDEIKEEQEERAEEAKAEKAAESGNTKSESSKSVSDVKS